MENYSRRDRGAAGPLRRHGDGKREIALLPVSGSAHGESGRSHLSPYIADGGSSDGAGGEVAERLELECLYVLSSYSNNKPCGAQHFFYG